MLSWLGLRVNIARMEKVSGKRKLITREQLVQMSSKTVNPLVRRSPRNHVPVVTPTTSSPLARKVLFPSQEHTDVPTMEDQVPPSTAAQKKQEQAREDVPGALNARQNLRHGNRHVCCNQQAHDTPASQGDGSRQPVLRRSARHADVTDQNSNLGERSVQLHLRRSPRPVDLSNENTDIGGDSGQPTLQPRRRRVELTNQISDIDEDSGQQLLQQSPRHAVLTSQGGYKRPNRRRIQAAAPRNSKGRGGNKTKALKDPVFVEVNEFGQPVGDTERPLASLIGCLARDPRRLPLDCWDWRYVSQQKKDAVWEEVKKCELKIAHFNGRTHQEAIAQRSEVPFIPEDMWGNLVEFWESPKGQARSSRNVANRSKLTMCHYAGTKSFARIRAEMKKKDGKEPDPLAVWLDTHQPKKGSRLDIASEATKKSIEEDLAALPLDSSTNEERMRIFKKHVGENKNGYAKTYGLGVKVPRSRGKRCALEEERAKRINSENKVEKLEMKLNKMTSIMKKFLELQGIEDDILLSDDDDVENGFENQGDDNIGNANEGDRSP